MGLAIPCQNSAKHVDTPGQSVELISTVCIEIPKVETQDCAATRISCQASDSDPQMSSLLRLFVNETSPSRSLRASRQD